MYLDHQMANRDAFDLFAFLSKLNHRDLTAFSKLTEEGQKAASPVVIGRWLAGTTDPLQLVRLNEVANRYIFSLGQDKALLFSLLAASCSGNVNRCYWQKSPGAKSERLRIKVICETLECTSREAATYVLPSETVVQWAEELGWNDDELKKLRAEVAKDEPGRTEKSSRGAPKRR